MRRLGGVTLVALAAPMAMTIANAHADAMAIYLQGQGGANSTVGETVGGEAGVSLLAFNAYVGYDSFFSHGSVLRAIAGLGSDTSFSGWRLSGRVGAGLMFEKGGAFGDVGAGIDRSGLAVRGGLALDRPLAIGLYLGIGLDAEYYGLKVTGNSALDTGVHT